MADDDVSVATSGDASAIDARSPPCPPLPAAAVAVAVTTVAAADAVAARPDAAVATAAGIITAAIATASAVPDEPSSTGPQSMMPATVGSPAKLSQSSLPFASAQQQLQHQQQQRQQQQDQEQERKPQKQLHSPYDESQRRPLHPEPSSPSSPSVAMKQSPSPQHSPFAPSSPSPLGPSSPSKSHSSSQHQPRTQSPDSPPSARSLPPLASEQGLSPVGPPHVVRFVEPDADVYSAAMRPKSQKPLTRRTASFDVPRSNNLREQTLTSLTSSASFSQLRQRNPYRHASLPGAGLPGDKPSLKTSTSLIDLHAKLFPVKDEQPDLLPGFERKLLQPSVDQPTLPGLKPKMNVLLDGFAFINLAAQAISQDEFSKCFVPKPRTRWTLQLVLFTPVYTLGWIFRYAVLFPYRLTLLLSASVFFFAAMPIVLWMRDESMQRWLFKFYCSAFLRAWGSQINFHGRKPVLAEPHVFVSNHTSVIDYIVLSAHDFPHATVAQTHGGLIGMFEHSVLTLNGSLMFNRNEKKDRGVIAQKMRKHVHNTENVPLLIFPEGTCVNNEYTVLFHKGAFELDAAVVPVAIKYDKTWADAYWHSKTQSFTSHILFLMTRWALVADVWYLPPEHPETYRDSTTFANAVKAKISKQAKLKNLSWDGYFKNFAPAQEKRERLNETPQKRYGAVLQSRLRSISGAGSSSHNLSNLASHSNQPSSTPSHAPALRRSHSFCTSALPRRLNHSSSPASPYLDQHSLSTDARNAILVSLLDYDASNPSWAGSRPRASELAARTEDIVGVWRTYTKSRGRATTATLSIDRLGLGEVDPEADEEACRRVENASWRVWFLSRAKSEMAAAVAAAAASGAAASDSAAAAPLAGASAAQAAEKGSPRRVGSGLHLSLSGVWGNASSPPHSPMGSGSRSGSGGNLVGSMTANGHGGPTSPMSPGLLVETAVQLIGETVGDYFGAFAVAGGGAGGRSVPRVVESDVEDDADENDENGSDRPEDEDDEDEEDDEDYGDGTDDGDLSEEAEVSEDDDDDDDDEDDDILEMRIPRVGATSATTGRVEIPVN
ncbi:hypothetical protein DFJ73DRAFT_63432 [Zopfochytrium polystomum]|nr:hypothetical protein DFJ73DRAFT_63432 [Zopfochytrium polystomum]